MGRSTSYLASQAFQVSGEPFWWWQIRADTGQPVEYLVTGDHDGFPAYELYLNRNPVYLHDPKAKSQTPFSLFPDAEWSVDTGWHELPAPPAPPAPPSPLQAPSPLRYQNVSNPLDVSGDGFVSALDAILVINELNAQRRLESSGESAALLANQSSYFTDTSGDGLLTPLDALLVINALNRPGSGEGKFTKAHDRLHTDEHLDEWNHLDEIIETLAKRRGLGP